MKATLITVGIILLIVGIVGLVMSYATPWMWVLVVLGVVGLIWGLMTKTGQPTM